MEPLWVYLVMLGFLLQGLRLTKGQEETLGQEVLDAVFGNSPLEQLSVNELPEFYLETLKGLAEGARGCEGYTDERFSRSDGLCNNLKNPFQGSVLSPQRRFFSNSYLDGRGFPRTRGSDFSELPSAREVSRRCFGADEDDTQRSNGMHSQILWQFAQLLAHDLTLVDPFHGLETCCDEFVPSLDHPDLHRNGVCFPIEVAEDDPAFNTTCMPFARSVAVEVNGVREQLNAVTSYIDASTIYGSTSSQTHDLRLGSQGLLRTYREALLPSVPDALPPTCRTNLLTVSPTCPAVGDSRGHEQRGLGAIHTLFHLEHNRIARGLFSHHPHWNDERLFQETRKIMIAIMQSITYDEYLPVVLGPDLMDKFHLRDPHQYFDDMDATIHLEFSTAAFRFSHSLVNTVVRDAPLSEGFFVANQEENDTSSILFYQARNDALRYDQFFTGELRENLFINVSLPEAAPRGVKFDLLARNIQRGRDHGIPPYTVVRDACREILGDLPGVEQNNPTCMEEGVYRHSDDVDLFVGGMSETPLPNATVGPTFACLLGLQFERLKFGDRFFFESEWPEWFTEEQRYYIKRNTLASLLCETAPEESLQRQIFLPVSESNPLVPCQTILEERGLEQALLTFASPEKEPTAGKPMFGLPRWT